MLVTPQSLSAAMAAAVAEAGRVSPIRRRRPPDLQGLQGLVLGSLDRARDQQGAMAPTTRGLPAGGQGQGGWGTVSTPEGETRARILPDGSAIFPDGSRRGPSDGTVAPMSAQDTERSLAARRAEQTLSRYRRTRDLGGGGSGLGGLIQGLQGASAALGGRTPPSPEPWEDDEIDPRYAQAVGQAAIGLDDSRWDPRYRSWFMRQGGLAGYQRREGRRLRRAGAPAVAAGSWGRGASARSPLG